MGQESREGIIKQGRLGKNWVKIAISGHRLLKSVDFILLSVTMKVHIP